MGKYFLFFLCSMLSLLSFSNDDNSIYLRVKAKKGDTVYGLLQSYRLHTNSCNKTAFYQINGLNANSNLLAGKEYKLPIKIFVYDGESIRTTTKNNNWERAYAIQDYNQDLKKENIKTYYENDKVLFVPNHLDQEGCFKFKTKEEQLAEEKLELEQQKVTQEKAETTKVEQPTTVVEPKENTATKKSNEPKKDSTSNKKPVVKVKEEVKEPKPVEKKMEVAPTPTKPVDKSKQPAKRPESVKIPITKPLIRPKYATTDIFFGKNHKVEIIDTKLRNQVFYIMSGHGGPDPGAMKKKNGHQLCEDEYAYDVAIRLARNLLQHDATVHLIIQDPNDGIRNESYLKLDRDEICKIKGKIPLNQLKRLQQRVDAVNILYKREKAKGKTKHTMISLHVDSQSVGLEQDVFFYYAPNSTAGKLKAQNVQQVFKEKYELHQKGRGYKGKVSSRNLYVLRKSHPAAVFVELANIQNVNNHKRILPKENRQILANWLYEGIIK